MALVRHGAASKWKGTEAGRAIILSLRVDDTEAMRVVQRAVVLLAQLARR